MHHEVVFSRAYASLTFAFGAFATVAQVVLLREGLVVLAGNELSIALSLAAWLVGVSLGAVVGGWWSDRTGEPAKLIALAGVLLTLITPIAVIALRSNRELLGLQPGVLIPPASAGLLCIMTLPPSSFWVGLSFAPLVRAGRGNQNLISASSVVYAIEGGGAFIGGLLFTLVLAGRLSSLVVLGLAGALLMSASSAVFLLKRHTVVGGISVALLLLWVTGIASGELAALDERTARDRWGSTIGVGTLVDHVETPYQHLELAESDGQFDLYSNGTPILSFPDPYEQVVPIHVAMTQLNRSPRHVLMIGGGVADRLAAALEHEPESVTYVSLDPGEVEIVTPYLPESDRQLLGDGRVRIVEEDGRRFVLEADIDRYDLIIVETPDPTTALTNRYYTTEFLTACSGALERDGVLASRIGTSVDYRHADVGAPTAVLYHTMSEVFENVAIWPGSTMRMFASKASSVVTEDPTELSARWRQQHIESRFFNEYRFGSLFPDSDVEEVRSWLTGITALPNRDANPVAYLYGLVLWDQRARGADSPSPLWTLSTFSPLWLLVPLVLLVISRTLLRRHGRRSYDGLWSTFSGGFTGLSLEVMLLLVFQNIAGSLYAAVGVLIALFMAGLTSGTVISERLCRDLDRARLRRWGAWLDVATISVVLSTPILASLGSLSGWLAGVWLVVAGMCTGAIFPPSVAELRSTYPESMGGRPAGMADASDHIGACLGAITLGIFIIPIGGLWGAAAILALLKATSLVGWLSRCPSRC